MRYSFPSTEHINTVCFYNAFTLFIRLYLPSRRQQVRCMDRYVFQAIVGIKVCFSVNGKSEWVASLSIFPNWGGESWKMYVTNSDHEEVRYMAPDCGMSLLNRTLLRLCQ